MAKGLNKVLLIGWVEGDAEMRRTPNGQHVTTFSLSTPRTWTSPDGESHEESEWFNIVAWGDLAEHCYEQLKKGMRVFVEGRLQTRGWEDKAGRKHFRTEVVAYEMIVLSDSSKLT